MVDPGGLYDINDVKILLLYVLKNINKPVDITVFSDGLLSSGMCDYFTVSTAVSELLETGHIAKEKNNIYATKLGEITADELYTTIPITAREKSISAVFTNMAKNERFACAICDVVPVGDIYEVTLKLQSGAEKLMSLTLSVPSKIQTEIIKTAFRKDPELIYSKILALLAK